MTDFAGTPGDAFPPSPAELVAYVRRYPHLVLVPAVLGVLATLIWLGGQTPQWSARATVLVQRQKTPRESAAAPLHAMAQNLDVAGQVALLSSQAPAAATVRAPRDAADLGSVPNLGLTAQVEDLALRPLNVLKRQVFGGDMADGLLRVKVIDRTNDAPGHIRLSFVKPGVVRVGRPRSGFPWGVSSVRELGFDGVGPIEYGGLRLALHIEGDLIGRSFEVRLHKEREAVRSLMERTNVEEVSFGTGVVTVTVSDTDPHRAADSANALVTNYLEHQKEKARERTEHRLDQVEGELRRIDADMREALEDLVRLRRESPLSIDSEVSAKSLTLNLTSRGVDYTGAQLELTLVEEAIESLEDGDVAALSRLQAQTTDELTRTLVTNLADLMAQAQRDRKDASQPYRRILREKLLRLEEARDNLSGRLDALTRTLRELGKGGASALAMLSAGTLGESDASTVILAETTARLVARRAELLAKDYLVSHPEIVGINGAIAANLDELQHTLSNRAELLRSRIDRAQSLVVGTRQELGAQPARDRADLEVAIERFRVQLVKNLDSLRDSLRTRVAAQAEELAEIEGKLAELPASERRQLGPRQVVENAKARVAELLETRDAVKMTDAFFTPPIEFVDPASPPARRDAPRTGFSLLLGAAAGSLAGLLLALLYDRTRGRLADAREVENELGLALLGTLDDLGLTPGRSQEDIRADFDRDPAGKTVESFRALRDTLLTVVGPRKDVRAIGFTSAARGEGKSVVSLGIGLACTRAHRRVLLVDANGARQLQPANERDAKRRTGPARGQRPGLAQALSGRTPTSKVIVRSGADKLDLLPAGGSAAAVADASASPAAAVRFAAISQAYDLVLVDLPSLEGHTEAVAVARLLSGIVVVCDPAGPTRDGIRRALGRLDATGIPILGAVFNRGTTRSAKTRVGGRLLSIARPNRRAA